MLTGLQPVKKFPAFYGTQCFITAFTSARHLSLSWASSIQSISPYPTSRRSALILSSHLSLGLTSGLFPSGFPTKTLYKHSPPHTRYMPHPSYYSRFHHPHNSGWGVQIIKLLIMACDTTPFNYQIITAEFLTTISPVYIQSERSLVTEWSWD
jgi:hypothetical protein